MTSFQFTAAQWKPIALILGKWDAKAKEDIERLIRIYQQAPNPDDERARYKAAQDTVKAVLVAVRTLQTELDHHGWDYDIRGGSLREDLEGIANSLEAEDNELRCSKPANKGSRKRDWLLGALCQYWFYALKRSETRNSDRVTSQENKTPAVAFLMAATAPVFDGHMLTEHMAGHAIDRYRGINRKAKSSKEKHVDVTRVFHSMPDEFDLACDFRESES